MVGRVKGGDGVCVGRGEGRGGGGGGCQGTISLGIFCLVYVISESVL